MIKRIKVDAHSVVLGYCKGDGGFKDGIIVNDIPADFAYGKYKYIDDKYVLNPDYDPNKFYDTETGTFVDPPKPEPTFEEQQLIFDLETDYRLTCLELGLT